ncbi:MULTISPECIES: glycosyltransferase family 2 protein [unclassified Pseudocitrobacter]|uniref:glycosyltransferase family 2 protein n=1 Tax=unclassified Pseudocitrobacter TaxID=2638778 RepID=UPI0023E46E41|nr:MULTISPECIES: glycosyltransferase family 2 protein [unclassified Pseudocitrobacter]MDF3828189.1 glycosyltransferase family 2 protein [Pseudocitrobacter sp. 2023EL-00150]MEC5374344.1 glycosyltransferase [Pseudocitrobacter sp. MW920760]
MILSIIITLYNRKELVVRALDSVIDIAKENNVEIVIVDDGSNDNPLEKISSYLSNKNVRYFYKENGGAGDAKNYGAMHACGDYIIFLDSDDYLINVDKLLDFIKEKATQSYDFIFSKSVIIKKNESETEVFSIGHEKMNDSLYEYILQYPLHYPGKPTYIFKRKAFIDSKGFNADFRWGDAMLFWRKFLEKASYHEITFPTYVYDHSGSNSVSRNRDSTYYKNVYHTLSYTYDNIEKELILHKFTNNWAITLLFLSVQQADFKGIIKYFTTLCKHPVLAIKAVCFIVKKIIER